jgi:two-component system, NtrC family, C4-dicarboxylate transport sensor histidine kinase DctB
MKLSTGTLPLRHPMARPAWQAGSALLVSLLVGWLTHQALLSKHLESLRKVTGQHMEFYRLSLESVLTRNESLPRLVAHEEKLGRLLLNPGDRSLRLEANSYLRDIQGISDIAAAYLMDADGLTLAASNHGEPTSYVGNNYAYRPYFRDAMQGRLGRFFGIGMTTALPGYFLAAPVEVRGKRLGVSAIKVNLDSFESALLKSGEIVLLADASGVIFVTSVDEWRYRTLTQLGKDAYEHLSSTRTYSNLRLAPLKTGLNLQEGISMTRITLPHDEPHDYLVQSTKVGHLGWRMVLLANTKQERQWALLAGVAAGLATAFLFFIVTHFQLTARRYRERRQAEAASRRAHLELEQRIAERTSDLVATNVSLEERIETLKTTENILRETRDNAVQAGKLAVLGQMSAGISHEINQPLTALHTLTDNAVSLLERGRLQEVRENLGLIRQMADRMGRIVTEIKTFARKSPGERRKMRLSDAIDQAFMLVEPRRRQIGVLIEVPPFPQELQVQAEPVRLEQVLVNLLRNALDAVADLPDGRVTVEVLHEEPEVRVIIHDNGPGIESEMLPRLFEPFFTTKPAGQGLGLGLAISRMIVTEMGGSLEVRNRDGGGAEFTIVLEEASK